MPFVAFQELCPDVAERETRRITMQPVPNPEIPPGEYAFLDMYCNEKDCDCRRVFFSVYSTTQWKLEAVITWGWEDEAFYARWLGGRNPDWVRELKGPILDSMSPQSINAKELLDMAQKLLLSDPAYVERIKRHYTMFRAKIAEQKTPDEPPQRKPGWREWRRSNKTR